LGVVGMVRWKRDAEGQIIGVEEHAIRIPGLLSILVSGDFLHPLKASETEVKGLAVLPLMGGGLTRHLGIKRIYLLGLVAILLAMMFLVLSQFVMRNHSLAYGILLIATTCMGVGFGLTVPAINTLAAAFFPHNVDKAVLVLNALLGVGTALAPVFVAIFVGLGIWWGLPVLVGALAVALLSFSLPLPLGETKRSSAAQAQKGGTKLPARFWVFATFALLYGICETMNGNWASPYMTKKLGASTMLASLALTTFWGR